jgi:hypothetical protein
MGRRVNVATPGIEGPGRALFDDGPARGVEFPGVRLPWFVRVVQHGQTGKWDILDQLDDEPRPGEVIYVYRQRTWSHDSSHGWRAAYVHVRDADPERCTATEAWRAYTDELAGRRWPPFGGGVFACSR